MLHLAVQLITVNTFFNLNFYFCDKLISGVGSESELALCVLLALGSLLFLIVHCRHELEVEFTLGQVVGAVELVRAVGKHGLLEHLLLEKRAVLCDSGTCWGVACFHPVGLPREHFFS